MERQLEGVEVLDKLIKAFPCLLELAYLGYGGELREAKFPHGSDEDPWDFFDQECSTGELETMYLVLADVADAVHTLAILRKGQTLLPESTCSFCAYLANENESDGSDNLRFDRNVFGTANWFSEAEDA